LVSESLRAAYFDFLKAWRKIRSNPEGIGSSVRGAFGGTQEWSGVAAKPHDRVNFNAQDRVSFGKFVGSIRQALNLSKLTYVIGTLERVASGDLKIGCRGVPVRTKAGLPGWENRRLLSDIAGSKHV
jgi:hypothetical protein